MNTKKLPAVRLPVASNGECITPDGLVIDLPASNKFSVSWPSDSRPAPTPPASERQNLSFSGNESESSDGESGNERRDSSDQPEDAPAIRVKPQAPEASRSAKEPVPRFLRALSMPLPSQLGPLKHPHKDDPAAPPKKSNSNPHTPPDSSRLHELSVELADSVQMMVQTILQVSPSQLLDPAKEQFSACSLSVPTPSMSAMLTTMKNLNYISANMAEFCAELPKSAAEQKLEIETPPPLPVPPIHTDFDIGEMLQSVGDSLSGAAAQAGVDLVLHHGDDIGLRHVCVRGDESGISYCLSHVVRQILATAQHGDSIVLGLLIGDQKTDEAAASGDVTLEDEYTETTPIDSDEPVSCTIRISHKFRPSTSMGNGPRTPGATPNRPHPTFSSLLLRRLLHQIGATLSPNLPPPKQFIDGRTCDFTLSLEGGSLSVTNTPMVGDMDEDPIAGEPSVEQLTLFADSLKGKRVTLYANEKGSFAQHLTSYLTAWGMDVTHVSPDGDVDGLVEPPEASSSTDPRLSPTNSATPTNNMSSHQPFSFIFIDDDVEVLKERLYALRNEQPQLSLHLRQRPALAAHHRPRSSPQIARKMGHTHPISAPPSVVVVHFTSLSNYKVIKDIVQSVMTSHAGSTAPLPEVMIIPKPAGPRRFLTALHTAVTKPMVDPFFAPIATSPSSPGIYPGGSFFHSYHNTENQSRTPSKSNRPSGSRSNSERSTKSQKDITDHAVPPLPSPLSLSDNVEYFSEAAAKLGTSPSSGLVIQSPDGQPAGIFFHPRGKTQRNPSSTFMERDKGHLYVPSERKHSVSRLSSDPNNTVTFSSLHAVASSPKPEARVAPPPSARAAARAPTSPRLDEHSPSLAPPSVLSRRPTPTNVVRKPTPPSSPKSEPVPPITRRVTPRRATQETTSTPSAPLAAAAKAKASAADGNIVPPISVLIVDDNPINQTILSTFMKRKKIKYDLANNGQEAVQKWRTGGFHLILMDIQMPVMDGIQATKEIRRLEHSNAVSGYPPMSPSFEEQRGSPSRTPSDTSIDTRSTSSPYRSSVIIVALTASSLQSDRVAALAAGCNDFLTKPVSLIWLNSKIIEWGSIKALQMWADLRPDAINALSSGQAVQARTVADRLHVPKGRSTPSPSRQIVGRAPPPIASGSNPPMSATSSGLPSNISVMPMSSNSSMFWSPDGASPTTFRGSLGMPSSPGNSPSSPQSAQPFRKADAPTPQPSAETLNELAKDLAQGGRRGTSALQTSALATALDETVSRPPNGKAGASTPTADEQAGLGTPATNPQ